MHRTASYSPFSYYSFYQNNYIKYKFEKYTMINSFNLNIRGFVTLLTLQLEES